MTPTLIGRWQTRLFILGTAGLAISLLFGLLTGDITPPLLVLGVVAALGFIWDAVYHFLQGFRWDQDWPPLFMLLAGIWEAAAAGVFIRLIPGFPLPTVEQFTLHYTLVWLASYALHFGGLRVLFPRWRFRGGRLV